MKMMKAIVPLIILTLAVAGCTQQKEVSVQQETVIQNSFHEEITVESTEIIAEESIVSETSEVVSAAENIIPKAKEDIIVEEICVEEPAEEIIFRDESQDEEIQPVKVYEYDVPVSAFEETPVPEYSEIQITAKIPEPLPELPEETVEDDVIADDTEAENEIAVCVHDWQCITHGEQGHWLAGLACDCGWTVYGDADDMYPAWVNHLNEYSPLEALLEHGGCQSDDLWIIDMPAWEEWRCGICGEIK